jgi:uncharacterized protein (TIGR02246 family)
LSQSGRDLEERLLSLEAEVKRLQDIEEIRTLRARYAEACDTGYDADAMAALFAPDGVWEFTNEWGVHRGRDEIRRFVTEVGKQITWALHFMICPVISVADNGTEATGTWYILELATMVGVDDLAERDAVVLSGTYDDTYVKLNGTWKFAHVTVHVHQLSNLDQGWVRQPLRGGRPSELAGPSPRGVIGDD